MGENDNDMLFEHKKTKEQKQNKGVLPHYFHTAKIMLSSEPEKLFV